MESAISEALSELRKIRTKSLRNNDYEALERAKETLSRALEPPTPPCPDFTLAVDSMAYCFPPYWTGNTEDHRG